jgi:hypothetical protein
MFTKYDALRFAISMLGLLAVFHSIGTPIDFSIDQANARVIDYTEGR